MVLAKDFYLLRTPLLPLNLLEQFDGLAHDQLSDRLMTIFSQPYLQEAIYIASPELYQECEKWQHGQLTNKKDVDKLLLSLFKYLLRMCTRCTPYGLFAGCAVGEFDKISQIQLSHPNEHKKRCRLDMNYAAELANTISLLPEVQSQLRYYPNDSLYRIGNTYRYFEYKIKNKTRTYHLSEITCSHYLEKIISAAKNGGRLTVLADCIVTTDIWKEEATDFINELVENQILVSELEPTITGEEFFIKLVKHIQALEGANYISHSLTGIQQLLQDQTIGIEKYLQTNKYVQEFLPGTDSKNLVQSDLFLVTRHNTLATSLIIDIQRQIDKLWPLSHQNENVDLKNFCKAFNDRYQDQETPLSLVLDSEAGIGYAGQSGNYVHHTPLVDDIIAKNFSSTNSISVNKMVAFQLKILHASLKDNQVEIELTDQDLEELKEKITSSVPDSLYLMGSILGNSASAVDAGDYQFELSSFGGPSAASLLGRFCHGDEVLSSKVQACLREEEQFNEDAIYAEVVHLPEARTGNVLQRPQLRDYEIVYLGKGSVAADHQIKLDDLMVSVVNNTITLRSKKLNKRIIPRLSSAHNFSSGSLAVYKFLGDLQFHSLRGAIGWQWNVAGNAPFLPRIRYGKIILSRCTWVLQKKDYPELNQKKPLTDSGVCELLKKIQTVLKLPQYIVIAEGDNELFINMNSDSCLHILAGMLVKKEQVILKEFLSSPGSCFVDGVSGQYTNEVIVPFKRVVTSKLEGVNNELVVTTEMAVNNLNNHQKINPAHTIIPERSFTTSSEWLYIKIYAGRQSCEKILKEVIKPMMEELRTENNIDKWFFIRYEDPESHLRLRVHHATDPGFWKVVLERFHGSMRHCSNSIHAYKIQTDTYEREIERYGPNTMELSEDIFYYDSDAVINCINLLEGEEGEKFRWLIAIRGIDILLNDFGYNLNSKAAMLKQLHLGFFSEFSGDKTLNNQLNEKYREHMHLIGSFLNPAKDIDNEIEDAIAIFSTRSVAIKKVVEKMIALQATDQPTLSFNELLPNYIHIFLNRILLSNHRKHELVIYHFLNKYYDSQIAITNQLLKKSI